MWLTDENDHVGVTNAIYMLIVIGIVGAICGGISVVIVVKILNFFVG